MARNLSVRVGHLSGAILHGRDLTTNNTGIQAAGLTTGNLTTYSGAMTVTTPNAVIDQAAVTGELIFNIGAGNVAYLRRSVVNASGSTAHGVRCLSGTVHLEQTEIYGAPANGLYALGGRFVASRMKIRNCEDGVTMSNNSELRESFIYGLVGNSESHFDGINADGFTGTLIERVKVMLPYKQTAAVAVGYSNNTSSGVCRDSFFSGGSYTMYCGPAAAGGIVVTGNDFDGAAGTDIQDGTALPQFGYVTGGTGATTWSGNKIRGGPDDGRTLNANGSLT